MKESDKIKNQIKQFELKGEYTIADLLRNDLRIALQREEYLKYKDLWDFIYN